MINILKQHIFVVDDEPKVRELVGGTLQQVGFRVRCFATANDCLEQLRTNRCDLLITDVKLPEMSGIELLAEAKCFYPYLPVLIITGYGDVPMAVKAMKAGASDFIEKPLERHTLLLAVELALKSILPAELLLRKVLTHTEMKVLNLILKGKTNKETAFLLNRSISTIEVHRKHIMHKLGVHNAIELVKRAVELGLAGPQAKK